MNFFLVHEQARQRALEAVKAAPKGWQVVVKPSSRNLEQSAKFHALCGDLEGVEWFGKPRSAEEWKVLLISGHAKATGRQIELVQGIEGELVNIRESTAMMSKERMSSLLEYTQAFVSGLE